MALVKCAECSNEVSTTAQTCPKCGAKVKKKTSLVTWLVLIFIGIPVLLSVVIGSVESDGSDSAKTPEQIAAESKRQLEDRRESYARIIAEREIRQRLKAPSTAKFSGVADTRVGPLQGGSPNEWIVLGHVDSQNSFGAMLRSRYQVVIEYEEGKYDSSRTKRAELLE